MPLLQEQGRCVSVAYSLRRQTLASGERIVLFSFTLGARMIQATPDVIFNFLGATSYEHCNSTVYYIYR